jgi:hypothetical protein
MVPLLLHLIYWTFRRELEMDSQQHAEWLAEYARKEAELSREIAEFNQLMDCAHKAMWWLLPRVFAFQIVVVVVAMWLHEEIVANWRLYVLFSGVIVLATAWGAWRFIRLAGPEAARYFKLKPVVTGGVSALALALAVAGWWLLR